jgi:hypothetical protein
MYVKKYNIDDFSNHLENNNLIIKDWFYNNKKYKILKYNKKNLINMNLENVNNLNNYRSVITDENFNILSFSPIKTYSVELFLSKFKEQDCIAEEFIEGTMINLFYDKNISKWEIATKSSVGANIRYFQEQKNFNKLFEEILEFLNIKLENFDKNYNYSFVMQHPDNKIVINIEYMRLYLIAIYKIDNNKKEVIEIENSEYNNLNLPEGLSYPYGHFIDSFDKLIEYYASMNTSINIMGIVVKSKTGERVKFRNPNYEYVKKLKGNSIKLQYQYLVLYQENKINEYLIYYPENKKIFNEFKQHLHIFTKTLHANYVNCYIKKNKELKYYPFQFRNHMYALHQIYQTLRSNNKIINLQEVIKYINRLEPARLMYSLNYHLRELNNNNNNNDECDIELS